MKNTMILAAAAVLALVACAKVETIQNTSEESAISFNVYASKTNATKAGGEAGPQTNFTLGDKNKSGFGVFCYYSDNTSAANTKDYAATPANTPNSNFLPNFMWNQQVNGNGDGTAIATAWTYTPVKYWPNEINATYTDGGIDKLTFFAYAPYVDAAKETGKVGTETEGITELSIYSATGDPTITYVIPADPADHVDVLYANSASLKNLTKPNGNTAVTFPFKHALTSVVFRVQTFIDGVNDKDNLDDEGLAVDNATTVTLTNLNFGGSIIYPSGTLNIATGEWTPNATVAKSFASTGINQVVTKKKAYITADGTNATDPINIAMIPNTTSTAYDISVVYTVETADDHLAGNKSTVTNNIKNTMNLSLAAGKRNIIDVVLGLYTVKVTATVEEWDDETAQEVDLPENN